MTGACIGIDGKVDRIGTHLAALLWLIGILATGLSERRAE
jgi:hypothetical protein